MTTLYDIDELQKKAGHLENILKIIKRGGHDEDVMYRLQIYCDWTNLTDGKLDDYDLGELEEIKEIIYYD